MGYMSITIKDDIYDQWFIWFSSRRYNLKTQFGITSFSGLMSVILSNQSKENHHNIETLLEIGTDKKDRVKII